jgi:hypothetical protein
MRDSGDRVNVRLMIAIGLVSWGSSAWAINKCTDAKGKTVYQDTACGVEQSQQTVNTGGAGGAGGAPSQASALKSERPAASQPDRKDSAERSGEPRRVVMGITTP